MAERWCRVACSMLLLVACVSQLPVGTVAEGIYFADCINLYSDTGCSMPRGSATLGRIPQTKYCLGPHQDCASAPDFQEAYSFECQSDNSSNVKIWTRSTSCSPDTPNHNVTLHQGECTLAFTDSRPPSGPVYMKLECDTEVHESETRAFLVSFGLNSALLVLLLALFCGLRARAPDLYETRVQEAGDETNLAPTHSPRPGLFGWLITSFKLTDRQMFEQCGLDGLMYTLLFRVLLKSFAACFIITAAVIMPINAHGGLGLHGVDSLSIANVTDSSPKLNAHFILTIVYSVVMMYALRHAYRKYSKFRYRYLSTVRANNYAVLVRDIPPDCATEKDVLQFFQSMHEEAKEATRFIDAKDLPSISKKRKKACKHLERALHKVEEHGQAHLRKGGCLGCGGEVVDAAPYWQAALERLNTEFSRRVRELTEAPAYLPSAIVTFRSVKAATIASQVQHASVPFTWTVTLAAEARDLLWSNLALPHTSRLARTVAVAVVTLIMMILWTIPVSFVVSLFSLQSLSRVIPQLKGFSSSNSVIGGFVEGFLASIILLVIMSLIPSVMRWLSHLEGHPTESQVGRASITKLFWFQVVNIFLVSLVFGSVLPILDDLRDNPGQLITLLGSSIPRTGLFFTAFVMVRACVGYPLQLLRVVEALGSFFSYLFFSATPKERKEAFQATHFDIPAYVSADVLVILVGMTYANVYPVIVPFFLVYLGLGYITNRYLLFFVYKQQYDSGGLIWPLVFDQIMTCLVISQVAVAAVLVVKNLIVQACLLLLLVLATAIFWYYMNTGRGEVGNDLALRVAAGLDAPVPEHLADAYRQPELQEDLVLKPSGDVGGRPGEALLPTHVQRTRSESGKHKKRYRKQRHGANDAREASPLLAGHDTAASASSAAARGGGASSEPGAPNDNYLLYTETTRSTSSQ